MITLTLAVLHARSKNVGFRPEVLYVGTFLLDIGIIEMVGKIFS